jgi:glycine dehydrogenase
MAHRLSGHYNLRYKNDNGRVAHELLIDLAEFEKSAGLKVMDFAKRLQVRFQNYSPKIVSLPMTLQDYGFHPPTCSWPISTCMLIEPTESESLEEIERYFGRFIDDLQDAKPFRFCDAMIQIRREAEDIITGKQPRDNNVLKNAPHPLAAITLPENEWNRYVVWTSDIMVYIANHVSTLARPYSRQTAAFPASWLHEKKLWPAVARINDGEIQHLIYIT